MLRIRLKKTLNWTSRVKIARTAARIEVVGVEAGDPKVRVGSFGLDTLNVSHAPEEWADAKVVLEANRLSTSSFVRLEVGRVADIIAKSGIQYTGTLKGFSSPEDISFTIKVVSPIHGRILAEGKNLQAEGDSVDREELLPVRAVDLGQEVWRVAWNESGPVLLVNSRIHDHDTVLTRDALMRGAVAPAALRAVLLRYALDEDLREEEWSAPWKIFIERLGIEGPSDDSGWEVANDWVDKAVGAFSERHAFKDRINDALSPGGEA